MDKPNVFIIESLEFEDEKAERFEGKLLSQIMNLSGKKSKYYYIRTKKELREVLRLFSESDYRYLHLSCHGNERSIWTTLDPVPFAELASLAKPHLGRKRLFISACSAVNDDLASALIRSSNCRSVIGPAEDVPFADAAITWASFYHLVFREDTEKMQKDIILSALRNVANTFGVSMNYFAISDSSKKGYKRHRIAPR